MPIRPGPSLPLPVLRALGKVGSDIRDARLRRRIPTTTMAQRASISRTTLGKVEKGDPAVDRHPFAALTGLSPALSCRSCCPHAPLAELVRLSDKSVADELGEQYTRQALGE